MQQERVYRCPPLVEAVCEFQFAQDTGWDAACVEEIAKRLASDFPERRHAKRTQLELSSAGDQLKQEVKHQDLVQFVRESPSSIIQVGSGICAASHLAPYTSWPRFRELVKQAFDTYVDVVQPNKLRRVGLRYINRIEFDMDPIPLHEFFNFYVHVGAELPQTHGRFIAAIQVPYVDSRDTLKVMLTDAPPSGSSAKAAMLLDIDYYLAKPELVRLQDAPAWIEEAHEKVKVTFEACITKALRLRFGEERSE